MGANRAVGDEHDALLPWLLRIARNPRSTGSAGAAAGGSSWPAPRPTASCRPSESAPRRWTKRRSPGWHVHESVHAALERLPPEQREVVQLAYFQGLTHSEIAQRLGIPMGTVKTRLRLAFDKLRLSLAAIKDWIA